MHFFNNFEFQYCIFREGLEPTLKLHATSFLVVRSNCCTNQSDRAYTHVRRCTAIRYSASTYMTPVVGKVLQDDGYGI